MTLGQFVAKYGTTTFELIVREAMRSPNNDDLQNELDTALRNLESVLNEFVYGGES